MLSFGKIKSSKAKEGLKKNTSLPPIVAIAQKSVGANSKNVLEYSHGFEKIYAIENIDVKSIRKVASIHSSKEHKPLEPSQDEAICKVGCERQLQFEFCIEEGVIESFMLDEPLQSLQLSLHAEKKLVQEGVETLRDLLRIKNQGFCFLKGLGQGHIDEITLKLDQYLGKTCSYKKEKIEFLSILRCLVAGLDNKKIQVILAPYNLDCHFPISAAEIVSVRHLQEQKKQEMISEALLEINNSKTKAFLFSALKNICDAFILPWLQRREGLALEEELIEYLVKKSEHKHLTRAILLFIQTYFMNGQFPLGSFLQSVEGKVFASSRQVASAYIDLTTRARSYFYKPYVKYKFSEFIIFLTKELSRQWKVFSVSFIEKTLRLSPQFRVRKAENGELMISEILK